ncbi:integration host factor subunit beta [candidate division FCPU426 bacterium]|nr:integration host factor subunit beta [candidate division FCPU426 bacterium]
MNKVDLAKKLCQRFGFTQREASMIVDHIMNTLAGELELDRRIELRGLGTFGTRQRRPSLGRVVKTGQTVHVPALRRVYFRPGRELKEISPPKALPET